MHPLRYLIDEIYHEYWGIPRPQQDASPDGPLRRSIFGRPVPRRAHPGEQR